MKRTALTRRTPLARGTVPLARGVALSRRTGMPRQPAQRPAGTAKGPDWSADTRDRVSSRSKGLCEIALLGECTGTATDMHHRRRRRDGDHTTANALHACRRCHSWAHAHPTEARHWGWIVPTWSDPARVPARIRGRRVLLLGDTYTEASAA